MLLTIDEGNEMDTTAAAAAHAPDNLSLKARRVLTRAVARTICVSCSSARRHSQRVGKLTVGSLMNPDASRSVGEHKLGPGAPRHACANAVSGLTTRQNRTRRTLSCTLSAAKVQPTTTLLGSLRSAKRGLHTALQSIHATNCASDVLAATNRGQAWARRRTW